MSSSKYFETLIQPLCTAEMQQHVVFSVNGFSYNSNSLAFLYTQTSKNHYKVQAISLGKYEEYSFDSKRDAVGFAIKLAQSDRAGKFQALKRP